jgi:hypothetical protein
LGIFYNPLKVRMQKGFIVLGLTEERRMRSFGSILYLGRSLATKASCFDDLSH